MVLILLVVGTLLTVVWFAGIRRNMSYTLGPTPPTSLIKLLNLFSASSATAAPTRKRTLVLPVTLVVWRACLHARGMLWKVLRASLRVLLRSNDTSRILVLPNVWKLARSSWVAVVGSNVIRSFPLEVVWTNLRTLGSTIGLLFASISTGGCSLVNRLTRCNVLLRANLLGRGCGRVMVW